jgi:hypothetical protein
MPHFPTTSFEHLGEIVPNTAYFHVLIPIPIDEFLGRFRNATAAVRKFAHENLVSSRHNDHTYYHEKDKYLAQMLLKPTNPNVDSPFNILGLSIIHRFETMTRRLENVVDTLPLALHSQKFNIKNNLHLMFANTPVRKTPDSVLRRAKRAPHVIAYIVSLLAGAAMATFMGLFTGPELQGLATADDAKLLLHIDENQEKEMGYIVRAIDDVNEQLRDIGASLNWWDILHAYLAAEIALRDKLDRIINLLSALHQHRLALDWFTPAQLEAIHQDTLAHAQANGLSPLTHKLSDYMQLETSFLQSDGNILIVLHVPATSMKRSWNLYQFAPFPIPLPNSDNFVIPLPSHDYIAIGPDNDHIPLTHPQLLACIQRNHIFMCSRPSTISVEFNATCIGSLYMHDSHGISRHCTFERYDQTETVAQVAADTFNVFTPLPFSSRLECANGTSRSMYIPRFAHLTVPQGCTLPLKSHRLESPISLIATTSSLLGTWDWDSIMDTPLKIANTINYTQQHLDSMMNNASEIRSKLTDLMHREHNITTMLRSDLHSSRSQSHSFRVALAIVSALTVVIVVAAGVVIYTRRKDQFRRTQLDDSHYMSLRHSLRRTRSLSPPPIKPRTILSHSLCEA